MKSAMAKMMMMLPFMMMGADTAIPYTAPRATPNRGSKKKKVHGRHVTSDEYDMTGSGYRKIATAGRNEPCPCDSGKKFKKCCINK